MISDILMGGLGGFLQTKWKFKVTTEHTIQGWPDLYDVAEPGDMLFVRKGAIRSANSIKMFYEVSWLVLELRRFERLGWRQPPGNKVVVGYGLKYIDDRGEVIHMSCTRLNLLEGVVVKRNECKSPDNMIE